MASFVLDEVFCAQPEDERAPGGARCGKRRALRRTLPETGRGHSAQRAILAAFPSAPRAYTGSRFTEYHLSSSHVTVTSVSFIVTLPS